jgi:hypothetical protein
MQLFGPQSVNLDYAKGKWASMNRLSPTKFFTQGMASQPPASLGTAMPGQEQTQDLMPEKTKQPTINTMEKNG